VKYKVGDKVWLARKNLKTARPSEKLDHRRLGPFEIVRVINNVAVELKLPATMKIHNVFHVSLVEPYQQNRLAGRIEPVPQPVIVDAGVEYEVEQLVDHRLTNTGIWYLVHWKGYGPNERTWETLKNLANAKELVQEYNEEHGIDLSLLSLSGARPKRGGRVRR
jgi:hypothetical protein